MSIVQDGIHVFIGITNNMYYIGLFFYAVTFSASFLLKEVREMIAQCLLLAPEISYAMIGIYIYPLIIFLYHKIFKRNEQENYIFLSNQTKLSASVSVSLGLIGTFIGLTGMITAISASLGGDGDVSAKMNAMISSISMALNSMSFAFLTSILGVAISVLLLISLNFFNFFYKKEQKKEKKESISKYTNEIDDIQKKLASLKDININIAEKIISISENNDLAKEISVHLATLSSCTMENFNVLKSIKTSHDDWKEILENHLTEEKNIRKIDNAKMAEIILEINKTTQWMKEKSLENKNKMIALLSMD
ncbi:hypothetical protein [Providencia sp. PROV259]|uniref:hypothetical protein n=1 Tax=Providencia sp. PROV259 TaxID=2949947 RepID=UPI00234AC0B5|nr:hypothetical protein [Providencia sp. PROV259]